LFEETSPALQRAQRGTSVGTVIFHPQNIGKIPVIFFHFLSAGTWAVFFVRIQPMHNKTYPIIPLSIFLLLSLACNLSTPEPTPIPIPTFTQAPPPTLIPTSTPIPPTATPVPPLKRPKYTLSVLFDYDAHTLTVDETIEYPNHTGNKLNALTLAVEPNLWSDSFNLSGISIDGTPVTTYLLDGQRLDVPLAAFIQPEATVTINLQYTLKLPYAEQEDANIARPRIYGYTKRQTNLVNWYPFVVPYINDEWVLHEPWFYGEHLVYESADYVVNIKFTDPATAPVLATSGEPFAQEDSTRYVVDAARAFAISASREFAVSSTQVGDVTISSYYFPLHKIAGQAVLKASLEALQLYSVRFGPYSHKTLAIVEADFKDSMEYSAFYYHSPLYYDQYDHTPMNYLTYIGVHETSHQWWFEQVANDQAQQPWLDESLATYSERVYYEQYYPKGLERWWAYRVDFFNPQGFIDIPIYDAQGFEPYRTSVYLQGAHFHEDLRQRIGDEAFFAFLQEYVAQGQNKIITANDFFRILSGHTQTDYSDIVIQYFRNVYQ
jgi:hypothetical protein